MERISRLAGGLVDLGVGRGDSVAILSRNSDYFHEVFAGVLWIGAVPVPLNTRWSSSECTVAIGETGTRVICAESVYADRAWELRDSNPDLGNVVEMGADGAAPGCIDYEEMISASPQVDDVVASGADTFGIFYTGGTTGHPKGVVLSHAGVMSSALARIAGTGGVGSTRSLVLVAPLFHLAGLGAWIQGLTAGVELNFIGQFDVRSVVEALASSDLPGITLVPTMIQEVLDHLEADGKTLPNVAALNYGAAPLPSPLLERMEKAFPHARLTQSYGMTELSPIATILNDQDHSHPVRCKSVGRAAPCCEVAVVGTDGVERPRGSSGEIVVRGPNVMIGYLHDPVATTEALRGGWMHTGDLGYMDEDGYLFLVDRLKDMVISGGENVYSVEVEQVIATFPGVDSCAVIGVPDERWGERVHAVVVPVEGASIELEALQAHCRQELAGYKLPRSLSIADDLPLSPSGKILKRVLRGQYS